jgi:DMSO/TMAO reductase YedYZ heme-binding membrane subunit
VYRYFTKSKLIIFGFDIIFSVFIYLYAVTNFSLPSLQNIRITQIYGLTSIALLFLSLIIVPILSLFPQIQYKELLKDSQKPLILSTFYFSLLHTLISFFGLLGGFEGLGFLSNNYLIAISISFTALLILLIATFATFDFTRKIYTKAPWYLFLNLLYVVGVLGLIHALLLGTHFKDLFAYIPQIVFVCFFCCFTGSNC